MKNDLTFGYMRFRWRDESYCGKKGCDECLLNPDECPEDCDKNGFYDLLSEEEAEFEEWRKFYITHPNFGKSHRDEINKKYNL